MLQRHLRQEMEQILPQERILYDEPMSGHCSFHTGGPADALASVRTEEELAALLGLLREMGEPYFLLGRGTNLLIGDGGFRGVIVTAAGKPGIPAGKTGAGSPEAADGAGSRELEDGSGRFETAGNSSRSGSSAELQGEEDSRGRQEEDPRGRQESDDSEPPFFLDSIRVDKSRNRIVAGAGATLKAVAVAAMEHGLAGLEFAAGIPGTVGGGLVMNAGAYGGEMKQVVDRVRLLMPEGTFAVYSGEEMEFGYRTSLLRRLAATALRAEFVLEQGDPESIRARIAELNARRREKQPLEYPSAGSTFKRPEGHFAGKLIMDAGLAGYSVGGAQVSEKHCGFVINRGGATSAQIRTLIGDVRKKVLEDTGISLEPEVIFLGEF